MLTLMTGMRERHDEVGSGLSALMFTLYEDQKTFSQSNSTTLPVSAIHLAVSGNDNRSPLSVRVVITGRKGSAYVQLFPFACQLIISDGKLLIPAFCKFCLRLKNMD